MRASLRYWNACVLCAISSTASAAEPAPVERYETKLPVSDYPAGAARTVVGASEADVLALVTDYAHYSNFITPFESSKVVGRAGGSTDVYLRIKILKGAAKIWAVVRFDPPKVEGDSKTVVAHLVKGNVKRLDAVWHIRSTDESHTRVTLELLMVPSFPVPERLVIPEVRDAAGTALSGLRDEAEKRASAK